MNIIAEKGFHMGAFWNPYGGIVCNHKKLTKKEVFQLKRKWSEQLQIPDSPFNGRWAKFKKTLFLFSTDLNIL